MDVKYPDPLEGSSPNDIQKRSNFIFIAASRRVLLAFLLVGFIVGVIIFGVLFFMIGDEYQQSVSVRTLLSTFISFGVATNVWMFGFWMSRFSLINWLTLNPESKPHVARNLLKNNSI